jgi:hypothetical protein
MKSLISAALALSLLGSTAALAQSGNNANPDAPGQDRTCLVTTGTPDSWNDSDVVGTQWLPRKAAEAQAAADPSTMRVFDYADDPLVEDGTYASAEALCNTHFTGAAQDEDGAEDDTGGAANGGANASANSAQQYAPGQQEGAARNSAPGQQDGPASDSAPGQVKKSQ